ncbi:hypothetical protein DIS24_g7657 [Lasiodiplodia hormozganensis]|uniref:Uncharacterized protein n=1 Tax=Lasiodiplodia hormozganensis TaxID=869390 RepID=A0AA40CSG9_9PEZI|nr:hypothetical protein DIS24_g7657 [Lasiodiplodia hormozganensis]
MSTTYALAAQSTGPRPGDAAALRLLPRGAARPPARPPNCSSRAFLLGTGLDVRRRVWTTAAGGRARPRIGKQPVHTSSSPTGGGGGVLDVPRAHKSC